MSTAYLDGLKNVSPHKLEEALAAIGVDGSTREKIYWTLYKDQRDETLQDITAAKLPHVPNEDLIQGRWLEAIGVQGRLTDAQMDSVGIAETKRVMVVVDGRMYSFDPDTQVVLYSMPAEPEA